MAEDKFKALRADIYKPLDEADRLEIRKHHRAFLLREDSRNLDNWLEGAKIFSNQIHETRRAAMLSSVEYGKIFVRFAFLLNGGAMIALLAFTGALFGRADIGGVAINFASKLPWGFGIYAGGLLFASLAAGAGYLNFQYVYGSHLGEGHLLRLVQTGNAFKDLDLESEQVAFNAIDRKLEISAWLGIAFGGISLAMFVGATFLVARAFYVLGV